MQLARRRSSLRAVGGNWEQQQQMRKDTFEKYEACMVTRYNNHVVDHENLRKTLRMKCSKCGSVIGRGNEHDE